MDNVQNNSHVHGCTNSRCQVARATKFCQVASNICGSSVQLVLLITLLSLRILRWLLHFWKICGPLDTFIVTYNCQKYLNLAYFSSLEVDVSQGIHTPMLTLFIWIQLLLLLICSWLLCLFCTNWPACTNSK
jgi:hypothetical protein